MKKYIRKARNVAYAQSKNALNKNPVVKKVIVTSAKTVEKITGLNIISRDNYKNWLKSNTPNQLTLSDQAKKSKKFYHRPLISIITPVYNTNPIHLKECINSVIGQTYDNWELILVDDKSTIAEPRKIIQQFTEADDRIKFVFNKKNMHISGASNEGIKVAKGEYIALLDHDDVLYPHALFSVVKSLQTKKHDFIYSDEDKISEDGKLRSNPFFKPDWSPDFLRSVNYITHFVVLKKTLITKVGGFRSEYDGAQDWDLFLRTTRRAKSIYHIQDILYGWRMSSNSTAQNTEAKPYVVNAQKKALHQDAQARRLDAVVEQSVYIKDYWFVNYKLNGNPLVSIIIPTKNQYKILKRCIDSIFEKTTYNNYEIVLVDTGSKDVEVLDWYKIITKNHKINIYSFVEPKFSYANVCNFGAQKAKGEYLVMLNNDTEVITPNWLELMLGDARRNEVGTVGALLLYPGKKIIQHAGIGMGLGKYAANLMGGVNFHQTGEMQSLYSKNKRNVSANTAACLMLKTSLFKELKGFNSEFSVTYNDVDLGLRVLSKGLLNVFNPYVVLTHYESISLGVPKNKKRDSVEFVNAKKMLKQKWDKFIKSDPYYNDNFSRDHNDCTIKKM